MKRLLRVEWDALAGIVAALAMEHVITCAAREEIVALDEIPVIKPDDVADDGCKRRRKSFVDTGRDGSPDDGAVIADDHIGVRTAIDLIIAVGAANNLLAALIDNHVYWGNGLGIDPRRVTWRRVVDMNDRALREIVVGLGGVGNGFTREDGFDITVASEVMAILCLATDLGMGLPFEHGLHATLMAMRLCEVLDVDAFERPPETGQDGVVVAGSTDVEGRVGEIECLGLLQGIR